MADEKITVVIEAKDEASPTIAALTKKVDKLEKDPATILLTSNAAKINRQMTDLLRQVDKLDASDPEVEVKTTQINALQRDLRQIDSMVDKLNRKGLDSGKADAFSKAIGAIPGPAGEAADAISQMVGAKGLAGGVVPAAGIASALFAAADHAADAALAAQSLASLTGASVEDASRLQAVWSGTGADAQDLTDVMLQMNGVLAQSPEIAKQLGINLRDGRTGVERMAQVIDKVSTSTLNASNKAQLFSQIFGEEGVRQVQSMITLVGTDLAAAMRDVSDNRVFNADDVETAQEYKQSINEIKGALQGMAIEIGQTVLPAVQTLTDVFNKVPDKDSVIGQILRLTPLKGPTALQHQIEGLGSSGTLAGVVLAGLAQQQAELGEQTEKTAEQIERSREGFAHWAHTYAVELPKVDKARRNDVLSMDQWIDKNRQFVVASLDTQRALLDLIDPINRAARASDALNEAFELDDHAIDTREQIVDVNDALRDLAEFIQRDLKGTIPNLLDPNDVNAAPYLAKFRSIRTAVQRRLEEVFTTGGPDAAKNWAERQITQIEKTLGGKLTREQIAELLGWEDLEATITVAVDKTSAKQAEALLDILRGLSGDTPWLAQVRLDLESGKLTPIAAQRLIAQQLHDVFGIEVPAELVPNTADAINGAQQFIDRNGPLQIGAEVASPKNLADMLKATQDELDRQKPVEIPARFRIEGGGGGRLIFQDAGGITPAGGGIVGERRPEIVNSRWLITQPTVVPPGTRVTSGARTARILRTRGTAGLRRYDAGGVVAGARSININVNAAVVGNRYDVMRAVKRAARDSDRLLGSRA